MSAAEVKRAGSARPPSGSAQQDTKSNLPTAGSVPPDGVGVGETDVVVVEVLEVVVVVAAVVVVVVVVLLDVVVDVDKVVGCEVVVEVGGATLVVGADVGATPPRRITMFTGRNCGVRRGLLGGVYRNS